MSQNFWRRTLLGTVIDHEARTLLAAGWLSQNPPRDRRRAAQRFLAAARDRQWQALGVFTSSLPEH